jgi:thiol-disulfide isomerase/thioredoxin
MSHSFLRAGAAALIVAAGLALAQPAPKDQPAKEPASKDPADTATKSPAAWPEAKKKELFAKNDLRGKPAPKLVVEKWLSAEPKTEGKVLLVDFWATWCGPCRALTPELDKFSKTFGEDLVVIGISDEAEGKVRPYMDEKKVTYAMATDTKGAMKKEVGVRGIPHVLLISSDGIVRWQGFPGDDTDPLNEAVIRAVIEADKAAKADREKAEQDAKDRSGKKKPAEKKPAEKNSR